MMVFPIAGLLGNRHVSHDFVLKCNDALKAHSHDPILRIRFLVPKIGSRRSDGPLSRFCFCGENVGRSLVVVRFSELTKYLQIGAKTITGMSCRIYRRLSSFKKSVG